jgi:hypothetical protein
VEGGGGEVTEDAGRGQGICFPLCFTGKAPAALLRLKSEGKFVRASAYGLLTFAKLVLGARFVLMAW